MKHSMSTYAVLFCTAVLTLPPPALAAIKLLPSPDKTRSMHTALARNCVSPSPRRVSFALPDVGVGGGFGDRLLGLVTTYYVAMMTGSKFYVNWTRPYDLRDYFDVVDCRVFGGGGAAQLRGRQNRASIDYAAAEVRAIDDWSYFETGAFVHDADRDIRVATNGRHWQQVVGTPDLAATAGALGLDTLSRRDLFKLALRSVLVRPKRHVVSSAHGVLTKLAALNPRTKNRTPRYVGVQLRCGSAGRLSWDDPARHSLKDVPCFVRETLRACGSRKRCPIFLTADSASVSTLFKEELDRQTRHAAASGLAVPSVVVAEADGPILHTDRTNTSTLGTTTSDPWLRSIVDWWVLQHASNLVISRSGFGETAAWASPTARTMRRVELGAPGACNVSDFTSASVF